jgi:diacylglycerol kinase family enzyme
VYPFSGVEGLRVESRDERPVPLQVDGDYIGEVHSAEFGVTPGGLLVVA